MARIVVLILSLYCCSIASAQKLGIDLSVVHLAETDGGNTTALVPKLGIELVALDDFKAGLQLGTSIYRDDSAQTNLWVGMLNSYFEYLFSPDWSVGALAGMQTWQDDAGVKTELGIYLSYDVTNFSHGYLNRVYAGLGTINHAEGVVSYSLGVEKDF